MPLFVPNAPSTYPLLIRQPHRLIAGVTNFLPDPVEDLALELAEPDLDVGAVRRLNEDGTWADVANAVFERVDGRLALRTPLTVGYLETAVLLIEEPA